MADRTLLAGLEHCVERPQSQSHAQSIEALAKIAMELMQGYIKDDGIRGVDDLVRWPVESMAFKFLEATTTAVSLEQLKQVR
jgi:hypothetical protein